MTLLSDRFWDYQDDVFRYQLTVRKIFFRNIEPTLSCHLISRISDMPRGNLPKSGGNMEITCDEKRKSRSSDQHPESGRNL